MVEAPPEEGEGGQKLGETKQWKGQRRVVVRNALPRSHLKSRRVERKGDVRTATISSGHGATCVLLLVFFIAAGGFYR